VDLLALHRAHPQRYPFLLQSVAQGTGQARYDILFAFPGETLRAETGRDFLHDFDERWRREYLPTPTAAAADLPFTGGWFVYLGYELAGQVEPSLQLPPAQDGLPLALATRIPAALIWDHERQQLTLMAEEGAQGLLETMAEDGANLAPMEDAGRSVMSSLGEDRPQEYLDGVRRIKDYIREGDVFQVNLSRRWQGKVDAPVSAASLYAQLCRHNPAPFAGLAVFDEGAIISSSPERLVKVRDGWMETRPIAGTRPRTGDDTQDASLEAELLVHPKERAEHIMLIDLERNDLGRVCKPGTVNVDELMVLERYAHVQHIVSNVRGRLRDSVTPGQAIRAVFPGGTITGCPKVRCMAIIAELEGVGRGAYTGSMGYINRDGSLDLNILIRTMVLHDHTIALRAGAGIVADSIPENELEETRAKAKGMLLALAKDAG
jgi:anthranilate synthase component 1